MKIPFLSSISQKLRGGDRPPFERFYIIALILFMAFMVGDIVILYSRQFMLPTTMPPKKIVPIAKNMGRTYSYPEVVDKNIFNSDGKIPPSLGETQGGSPEDNVPRKTSLPLDLIGTIVHANPKKSVATINVRGQNKIEPYKVGQKIESMAEVTEIQKDKVIFRNSKTRILEFVDIPQDAKIVLSTEKPFSAAAPTVREEKLDFNFPRKELEAHLNDLSSLLQQARVVPETGPDGQVRGYKLVELQPGSIFEKLGVRIGDTIMSVNGEAINSPQKAMDMFRDLRSANEIKLGVDRGGADTTLNYKIQ